MLRLSLWHFKIMGWIQPAFSFNLILSSLQQPPFHSPFFYAGTTVLIVAFLMAKEDLLLSFSPAEKLAGSY